MKQGKKYAQCSHLREVKFDHGALRIFFKVEITSLKSNYLYDNQPISVIMFWNLSVSATSGSKSLLCSSPHYQTKEKAHARDGQRRSNHSTREFAR